MFFKCQKNRGWTIQIYLVKYNTAKGVEKYRAILQEHICTNPITVLSHCPYAP